MECMQHSLIAQISQGGGGVITLLAFFIFALMCMSSALFVMKRYKRCPPNRALVVYGKVAEGRAAIVIQSGGVFVLPLVQDYAYLSLEPMTVDSQIDHAVTRDNGQASVTATYTLAISSDEHIIETAAERLLGLGTEEIAAQASDIIEGQFRRQAAGMTTEQFHEDRGSTLDRIEKAINANLNQVGLFIINTNVRELTAQSGTPSRTTSEAI